MNRQYPIKVRLVKPNPLNQDKIVVGGIELYTYKDTIINDEETFCCLIPMISYLIIRESTVETKQVENTKFVEIEYNEPQVEVDNEQIEIVESNVAEVEYNETQNMENEVTSELTEESKETKKRKNKEKE